MNFGKWLGLLSLVAALYILWQIQQLLLLVFTAVLLATALNRLTRQFQKSGMPRGRALLLTLGVSVLTCILFVWLIIPPFIIQFQRLVELLPTGLAQVRVWFDWLRLQLPPWLPEPPDIANLTQQIQPIATQLFRNFFALFSNTLTVVAQLLFVLVLTLMLLAQPMAYRRVFILLFPSFYRRRADAIVDKCETSLGNWVTGVLINSLFIATLSGVGLWILQVDLVLVHALTAGLLNFIPNIGPTLSVIFPMAIALLDAPWKVVAVLILYLVIQQIESFWLTPTVMAKQVALLPALTLVAQIAFASFFGFLGLLLAIPLTVVAKVWLEEALIKDVLDHWDRHQVPYAQETEIVIAPAAEVVETVEETQVMIAPTRDRDVTDTPTNSDPESEPE